MDKQMKSSQLSGDSKIVIEWATGRIHNINAPQLQHLLRTIKEQIASFETISFKHIYMELNTEANKISKLALSLPPRLMEVEEKNNEHIENQYVIL